MNKKKKFIIIFISIVVITIGIWLLIGKNIYASYILNKNFNNDVIELYAETKDGLEIINIWPDGVKHSISPKNLNEVCDVYMNCTKAEEFDSLGKIYLNPLSEIIKLKFDNYEMECTIRHTKDKNIIMKCNDEYFSTEFPKID